MDDDILVETEIAKPFSSSLVQYLQMFNRKERYWLLKNALGELHSDLPLSISFRKRLSAVIEQNIPEDAWWAIDFHIDWLFGALVLDRMGSSDGEPLQNPQSEGMESRGHRLIRGTQEDFDLIVAFDRTIILIEAKGVTNWGNEQLASKCRRLHEWDQLSEKIVSSPNEQMPFDIFLVLTSPKRSQHLKQLDWPNFVRLDGDIPFFLPLDLSAAPEFFYAPERCDLERRPAASGNHWRLNQVPRPRLDES